MNETPPPIVTKIEQTLNRLLDPRHTMLFKPKKRVGNYAHFNERVFATAIDMLWIMFLLGPVILQIRLMIYGANPDFSTLSQSTDGQSAWQTLQEHNYLSKLLLEYFLSYLLVVPFFALMWSYSSTTPGKWLLRLRIVDSVHFTKLSHRQMVIRLLGYALALLPFGAGIAWIGLDKQKRGLHDHLAGTAVVRVKHWRIRDDGSLPHLPTEHPDESPEETSENPASS